MIALAGAVLLWMALVRGSISPAWPLGVWLSLAPWPCFHAKRLQRFERAKAAGAGVLRGLDRVNGDGPPRRARGRRRRATARRFSKGMPTRAIWISSARHRSSIR